MDKTLQNNRKRTIKIKKRRQNNQIPNKFWHNRKKLEKKEKKEIERNRTYSNIYIRYLRLSIRLSTLTAMHVVVNYCIESGKGDGNKIIMIGIINEDHWTDIVYY